MKNLLEKEVIQEEAEKYFPAVFAIGEYEVQSICTTCIHAENCIYRGDGKRTILSCDEFEVAPGSRKNTSRAVQTNSEKQNTVGKTENFKGLCANCDHRHYCQYADTETGIWYCEEYK